MNNYLLIYHAPAEAMAAMASATEEQKMEGMKGWFAWKERCGDAIVDFGAPLAPGDSSSDGSSWASANGDITGYSVIQASDLDHAKQLLEGHPHIGWAPGCTIDIHECIKM